MAKLPHSTPNQLELRLLVDLKGRAAEVQGGDSQASSSPTDPLQEQAASESDRSVYRMIANDYFSSLRNAEIT